MEASNDLEWVLMPGLDGTGIAFQPLFDQFSSFVPVTVVSYPPDKSLSYTELCELAARQLPRDRPCILIAESFSGPIALNLLRRGNTNIQGAVFCASFASAPRSRYLKAIKFLPLSWLLRLPVPSIVLRSCCLGASASKTLIRLFREVRKAVKPGIMAQRLRLLTQIDETAPLEDVKIPCCYIQASDDRLVPPSSFEVFKSIIPGVEVHKIGGPHFILQTKAKECIGIIETFVNDNFVNNNPLH